MKKISLLFFTVVLALTVFSMPTFAGTYGDLTYTISNNEVTITDCKENIYGALEIPANISGYPVTSIGSEAFYNCTGLTSVSIPDSVTSIESNAFCNCTGLTKVNITDLAAWCNIDFGSDANANPLYYAHNLYLNDKLVTDLEIPAKVTKIKNYAFYGCSDLNSVSIPDGVTSIGRSSFCNCSGLTSVSIPDSVTNIGNYAFYKCTNAKFTLKIGKAVETDYTYNDYTNSYWNPIRSQIRKIEIADGVTKVGDYAFYGCTGLTSVSIPDGVTSIGENAFNSCYGLTEISIPDGVTKIDTYAFCQCHSLASVTIPDSVTSIGNYTFSNCSGLTSVSIPDSVTSIDSDAFYGCSSAKFTLKIGKAVETDYTSIGYKNSYWNPIRSQIDKIEIADGVTKVGSHAFYNCTKLTSITIHDSVTSIGDSAFSACTGLNEINMYITNLKSWCTGDMNISSDINTLQGNKRLYLNNKLITDLVIPENITKICNSAFSNCVDIVSVHIPNSVTNIDNRAFYGCSGLTSLTIPNSVESIGYSAFSGCTGISSLTVPANVKTIGIQAFYGCTSLSSVSVTDTIESIGTDAFKNCSNLLTFILRVTDNGAMTDYANAAARGWDSIKTKIARIIISDTVTTIGDYAFSGCTKVSSVTIPENVTKIGTSAFSGCSGISVINIPDKVTSIGNEAFINCTNLYRAYVLENVTSIGDFAFHYCPNLTVYGITNTQAETYADEYGTTFVDLTPYITAVYLTPTTLNLNQGNTGTLYANVNNNFWYNENKALGDITWSTSNPNVATVKSNGVVTAVGVGTATITVKTRIGGRTATCAVTVVGHTHSLVKHDAKAATTTAAGNTAYWSCAGCGKYFSDANGTKEIAANSWVIPKLTEPNPTPEPTPTPTPTVSFNDVKTSDYFYKPVNWAVAKNVTTGVGNNSFAPSQTCTRGQTVTFLWRAAGCPEPTGSSNPFTDVKSSDYFYKAVLWAVEKNITTGTGATTFSPNQGCTRGQVVTFLWRANGQPGVSASNPFNDVISGQYYYTAVLWAVSKNITTGTSTTTFSPNDTCIRGQIVTFLYRNYN